MAGTSDVVLVDLFDQPVGTASKADAHRLGLLHRAFSVFLLDGQGRVLLQRRASGKYHSAGLWANTCCSHPTPGEDVLAAAKRRLKEELGIEIAKSKHESLTDVGTFTYRHPFELDLCEYELDHVIVGECDRCEAEPDPREVGSISWVNLDELADRLMTEPESFAVWVPGTMAIVLAWLQATREG